MALKWRAGRKAKSSINIWLVDDRPKNREAFEERYSEDPFHPKTFSTPEELLEALGAGNPPDALLCDIYYYDDEKTREEVEAEVDSRARDIRQSAEKFRVEEAQRGVCLIEQISQLPKRHQPPVIYAYTSKGPYLLGDQAFDKLEKLQARWLFKNKYSPEVEANLVRSDVEALRRTNSGRRRVAQVALATGAVSAVLGAVLGVLAERLLVGRPMYILLGFAFLAVIILLFVYRLLSAD